MQIILLFLYDEISPVILDNYFEANVVVIKLIVVTYFLNFLSFSFILYNFLLHILLCFLGTYIALINNCSSQSFES